MRLLLFNTTLNIQYINKQTMRLSFPRAVFPLFFLAPLVVNANSRGIAYPSFRYVEYDTLNADTVALATSLGYDADYWNKPGTNPTESSAYANLGMGQETISKLGFNSEQWDCYVNHYLDASYFWDELPGKGVQDYLIGIGYNEDVWESRSQPEAYYKDWDELTQDEQGNATELCYFQEIWDREALVDWEGDVKDLDARGIAFPAFRYIQFQYLDASDQAVLVNDLGYDLAGFTWDLPGSNTLELISYSGLGPNGQQVVTDLGFTKGQWDCYISHYHYQFFTWPMLDTEGVQGYFAVLGYNETTWTAGSAPALFSLPWDQLSEEQRANAEQLCYFKEIWDSETLDAWTSPAPTQAREQHCVAPKHNSEAMLMMHVLC
jgi:hypothetical protein